VGVAVIAAVTSPQQEERLRKTGKPVVNVSFASDRAHLPRVGVNDVAVGQAAARHLIERGLHHFACITSPGQAFAEHRRTAFHRFVNQAGFTSRDLLDDLTATGIADPWSVLSNMRGLGNWMAALPKPVGVFAVTDELASRATSGARLLGLSVPDELAILGVDNDELVCEGTNPPLSSVQVPGEAIGRQAAEWIDRMLRGESVPDEPALLDPAGVVARQSTNVLAVDDADIAEALTFIRTHANEPIQVGDVASAVGLSRRALEQRIKSAIGRTPLQEIIRQHVDRAKMLLATTDLSIAEVAAESGFTSYRRLCDVFRKHEQATPSAYRRRTRRG
jgi:LacI family transcriptional regulator